MHKSNYQKKVKILGENCNQPVQHTVNGTWQESIARRCLKYAKFCKTLNFSLRDEGLSRIDNLPLWNLLPWVNQLVKDGEFNPYFLFIL